MLYLRAYNIETRWWPITFFLNLPLYYPYILYYKILSIFKYFSLRGASHLKAQFLYWGFLILCRFFLVQDKWLCIIHSSCLSVSACQSCILCGLFLWILGELLGVTFRSHHLLVSRCWYHHYVLDKLSFTQISSVGLNVSNQISLQMNLRAYL